MVGAGSVVTKDVPDFCVTAGNPAGVLRKIETQMDPSQRGLVSAKDQVMGAEMLMAQQAKKVSERLQIETRGVPEPAKELEVTLSGALTSL